MLVGQTPPAPTDAWELARWEATGRRRRMLTGKWRPDLTRMLRLELGADRAEEIGSVDLGSNVFASVCSTLAVTYDVAPVAMHPDPAAAVLMNDLLDAAGYAPTMQEVQRLTLGLREMLIDVEAVATPEGPLPVEVTLRPVYPDLVIGTPSPTRAYEPVMIEEAALVEIGGVTRWVWERVSSDPDNAYHRLHDGRTLEHIAGADEDVIRDQNGKPVMPYVMYHATVGPRLWDHTAWQELVDGTMLLGVKRSAASHALVMAAWQQRYTIGLKLGADEKDGRQVTAADPTLILDYEHSGEGNNGSAGAFPLGFDPETFQNALREAESHLGTNSGIPVTDLLRGSGDQRSGFSLLLSRDSKREASRRLEPSFRRADVRLLSTIASVVNHVAGKALLPESGWGIAYRAHPLTEDERAKRQDRVVQLLDKNLISPVAALMRLEDVDEPTATAMLNDIPTPPPIKLVGSQAEIKQLVLDTTLGDVQKPVAIRMLVSVFGMALNEATLMINAIVVTPREKTP